MQAPDGADAPMRLHRSEARWGEDRTDEDRSRSAWSPHSYVNISYLQECYESRVLSRHRSAQIRAIAILRHKAYFAYECLLKRAVTWHCMHGHAVLSSFKDTKLSTTEER